MELIIDFFFKDPVVRWVLMAVILMCASAAIVGCFTFLRKRALVGDAISHAILPGICLAFIIAQTKNPMVLMLGAFGSGWLGLITIDFITNRTKLKTDAALGLVLSVFYGFGILLLTTIQNSGNASQSGLDKFLFGNAAAMMQSDAITFGLFSLVLIILIFILFNPLKLVTFDRNFAISRGIPVKRLELLLSVLTVFAIAIGIQAVGVVLMAALLITPASAARFWTHDLKWMIFLAAAFAVISGIMGTFISYTLPKMPTGPWIVTILSTIAIISIIFGFKKGILSKVRLRRLNKKKILRENILKCLYHLGEKAGNFDKFWSTWEILEKREMNKAQLKSGLKQLESRNLVILKGNAAKFSELGKEEGRRVTKIHRLWEIYLTKYMKMAPDHVHNDAEAMEHLITPEIEKDLEVHLKFPLIDPHDSPVPYKDLK
ncbi:iron chelate uptake ABC transporter family permease subunit [Flexithrix dorotheae]|uniref:metal ABC transporter permease n=1 Tax=Flexithrix dorotheae TaxID=70993 RepID=UPI0003744608|nr:iron chelate uptake ABC transporter family permease subunit [Flexithrix dorotheae]